MYFNICLNNLASNLIIVTTFNYDIKTLKIILLYSYFYEIFQKLE